MEARLLGEMNKKLASLMSLIPQQIYQPPLLPQNQYHTTPQLPLQQNRHYTAPQHNFQHQQQPPQMTYQNQRPMHQVSQQIPMRTPWKNV